MKAIADLKRAMVQHGMRGPEALQFPAATFDKLMDGMADSYGITRAELDERQKQAACSPMICGVMIERR